MLSNKEWDKFVESLRTWIYIMQDRNNPNRQKIGVSRKPRTRASQLKTNLLHTIECSCGTAYQWEKFIHGALYDYHLEYEWFDLTSTNDRQECLNCLLNVNDEKGLHDAIASIRKRIREV